MPKKYYVRTSLSRIFNSVVTRLLVLALCIFISGAVLRYFVLANFLREDLSAVVENQQLALATYVAHDIDGKIVQRQVLLERLAASLPTRLLAQPEQLRAWLKEHFDYQTLFSAGLFVVTPNGVPIADYPVLRDPLTINYADRDYVKAGLGGASFVGRPVVGRAAKEPVLPISAPIRNESGEVQAVLVGVTALAAPGFLDSLLQSRIGNATGGFLLVSPRDKLFVASSDLDKVLKPTPPPGVDVLHDRAMAGFRGAGITVNEQGVEEVAAMVSVPSAGWFVVGRVPSSEAFATVGRMQHFLIKNAVFAILVFAVSSSIGLYFVLRHLFYAAEHADRMTRDELPLEPLPVVRDDEVGHLISAFNRLLIKLNDHQTELTRMAHHDTLTGLPNRAHLSERLRQVLALARRNEAQVGLLFMDLDGFKNINDTLGHEAGDEVLRQVAKRFANTLRESDTLARIGGDEFVLLLSDLEDDNAEEAVSTVAAKCIDALKTPFFIFGTSCIVGVSIGVALWDRESSADNLLRAADRVMYQAKKTGRGKYIIYKH
jgi:diguanylate cyclase (GGDEF)-like protein